MQTMSLQQKATVLFAEKQHRASVSKRLDDALETGQCTPAEHKDRRTALPAVKLSLTDDGQPEESDLEKWITSREAVPRGSFWDPESKIRLAQVIEPPDHLKAEPTDGDDKATASWALTGKRKAE